MSEPPSSSPPVRTGSTGTEPADTGSPSTGSATTGAPTGPADGRDVEEMRAELGDTVEELAHRVDVPTRLREKRAETTERVRSQVAHAKQVAAEKRAQGSERMQAQVARAKQVAAQKRAEGGERVQAQLAQAREIVAQRRPAVESALRERPAVLGAIAAVVGWLFLRTVRRRRTRRKEDVHATR